MLMTSWYMTASLSRRCEERSDAAISLPFLANVGCHDNQAMQRHRPRPASAAKLLQAKRSAGLQGQLEELEIRMSERGEFPYFPFSWLPGTEGALVLTQMTGKDARSHLICAVPSI